MKEFVAGNLKNNNHKNKLLNTVYHVMLINFVYHILATSKLEQMNLFLNILPTGKYKHEDHMMMGINH